MKLTTSFPSALPTTRVRCAATVPAGISPAAIRRRQRASAVEELAERRDDVRARRQEGRDVVDVEAARHVDRAVGTEVEDRLAVGGGEDAGVRLADQRAGVGACLALVVHPDA